MRGEGEPADGPQAHGGGSPDGSQATASGRTVNLDLREARDLLPGLTTAWVVTPRIHVPSNVPQLVVAASDALLDIGSPTGMVPNGAEIFVYVDGSKYNEGDDSVRAGAAGAAWAAVVVANSPSDSQDEGEGARCLVDVFAGELRDGVGPAWGNGKSTADTRRPPASAGL